MSYRPLPSQKPLHCKSRLPDHVCGKNPCEGKRPPPRSCTSPPPRPHHSSCAKALFPMQMRPASPRHSINEQRLAKRPRKRNQSGRRCRRNSACVAPSLLHDITAHGGTAGRCRTPGARRVEELARSTACLLHVTPAAVHDTIVQPSLTAICSFKRFGGEASARLPRLPQAFRL